MQQSWGVGIKEALFWLGAISLNLGVLNLLPIPVSTTCKGLSVSYCLNFPTEHHIIGKTGTVTDE